MRRVVYLDYNATTPVDDRVSREMAAWHSLKWGNPASPDHHFGWEAQEGVEQARGYVAELIGAQPSEIVFTSSATEGVNLALRGSYDRGKPLRAVTFATEHEAVLAVCGALQTQPGNRVEYLPIQGLLAESSVLAAASSQSEATVLVSLMLANNETGAIHPIRQFADVAHSVGAFFFSDVTQAVGKVSVDVRVLGIDLAAFSAHKLYGPKGVGALYIRSGKPEIKLEPLIVGGGQERGRRAGTLNVPGIVGFGEACRIAKLEMAEDAARISQLRDRLESTLLAELPDLWINGDRANRLPNTTNIGFRAVDARALIRDMHDIAVSTKSACSSDPGPSHVLKALGLTDDEAYSCIRFSLGRFTTEEEIDYTIGKVVGSVRKLRKNLTSSGG